MTMIKCPNHNNARELYTRHACAHHDISFSTNSTRSTYYTWYVRVAVLLGAHATDPFFRTTYAVYDGVYHTRLWGGFPRSIARQPSGCQYRTIRFRKALDEMCSPPTCFAPVALSRLRKYRARETGRCVCDYTVVPGIRVCMHDDYVNE